VVRRLQGRVQTRQWPLLLSSDHASRFLLFCEALDSTREDPAITAFERLFRERGLPLAIRSDNGVPFASANALFNLSKLSVWWLRLGIRPSAYKQNGEAIEAFKKLPHSLEEIRSSLAPDTPVEVWFRDEMRVGQKNKLTYRWARKGLRPRAARDQRTQSTYLFGAVCPELGTGAALVLPLCNSEAMQLHLNELALFGRRSVERAEPLCGRRPKTITERRRRRVRPDMIKAAN
jgi:DDE superfamily endonuclease